MCIKRNIIVILVENKNFIRNVFKRKIIYPIIKLYTQTINYLYIT